MARYFNANADRLDGSVAPQLPLVEGSMLLWLYPTHALNDNALHIALDFVKSGGNYRFLVHTEGNQYKAGFYNNGPDYRLGATAATYLIQNAWNSIIYTWSTTAPSRNLVINGTSRASSSAANATIDMAQQTYCIGLHLYNNDRQYSANARIAHVTFWNRVLSADEIAALNAGVLPTIISEGLTLYWPITGINSPEPEWIRNTSVTVTGNPAKADEPPIVCPQLNIAGDTDIEPTPRVSEFYTELLYGGVGEVRTSEFYVEAVFAPGILSYVGSGEIKFGGSAITAGRKEKHCAEAGNIIITGPQVARKELHRAEPGSIIIDGLTIADPQIAVDAVVTQTPLEVLARYNSEINITQAQLEILTRHNTEIYTSQTMLEVLASSPTGWERPQGDFWMVLMRLAASQAAARSNPVWMR